MTTLAKGLFISFEGIDGSGKSTQATNITQALTKQGYDVLLIREPGGTPFGEKVRNIVKGIETPGPENYWSEALLFNSARAQLISDVILPALKQGKIVIADRFVDSTLAYQGAGRELGMENIKTLHRLACQDLWPAFTYFFAIRPETAKSRRDKRSTADRIESSDEAFMTRVSSAYSQLAREYKQRYVFIDANKPESEVSFITLKNIQRKLHDVEKYTPEALNRTSSTSNLELLS